MLQGGITEMKKAQLAKLKQIHLLIKRNLRCPKIDVWHAVSETMKRTAVALQRPLCQGDMVTSDGPVAAALSHGVT